MRVYALIVIRVDRGRPDYASTYADADRYVYTPTVISDGHRTATRLITDPVYVDARDDRYAITDPRGIIRLSMHAVDARGHHADVVRSTGAITDPRGIMRLRRCTRSTGPTRASGVYASTYTA